MILTIILGLITVAFFLAYRYVTKNRGTLEQLGIPVIKPGFFLGSPPYGLHKVNFLEHIPDNFKRLNTLTYGHYDGRSPVVVTMDQEIIKSVLVKNFDAFSDIFDLKLEDKYITLDMSGGETWKRLRKSLSPVFTSGKLKGMLVLMSEVLDSFVGYVDEMVEKDPVVDLKPVYQGFSMDIIAKCAFGIEMDAYRDREQSLAKAGRDLFQGFSASNWGESIFFVLFNHFPFIMKFINIWPAAFDVIYKHCEAIMGEREKANVDTGDFMSRLLEMKKNADAEISEDMIKAQSVIFFAAGFETTANTLCTLSYILAKNPEIQERLYQEVSEVVEDKGGKLDHETILEMKLLESAINENLRLHGPASMHLRTCGKDTEVKPGLVIKKGMRVDMPIYAAHHNPDFFPEPEKFDVERFLPENKDKIPSFAFRPFGGGPRQCIGQRFAMTEMKLAMAKLILTYKVLDSPETELKIQKGDPFLIQFKDLKVKLEKRK